MLSLTRSVRSQMPALLALAATAAVCALVRVSSWPASSVKVTRTLTVLPASAGTRV